jgi:hypothetical protein
MSCVVGGIIRWSDIKEIADRIDELAITKSTPDYEPLTDELDMPFKFDEPVPFNGAVYVSVSDPALTVVYQYLSTGVTSSTPFSLDPVLEAMGLNEDLQLKVDADDCICTTIFNVVTSSGDAVIEELDVMGCCQSLPVPQPSGVISPTQNIIQYPLASYFASHGNSGAGWITRPACAEASITAGFLFTDGGDTLFACSRELSGVFTWPIRKAYFDKMIEKLEFILACDRSGGAGDDEIRIQHTADFPAPRYLPEGCEVRLCTLIKDRTLRGTMSSTVAGGLRCSDITFQPPWESDPYGESCDAAGMKVYCETLLQLEHILDIAEDGVRERIEDSQECVACDCGYGMLFEQKRGSALTCLPPFDGENYILSSTTTFNYRNLIGDEGYCANVTVLTYPITPGSTSCNGTETTSSCSGSYSGSGEDCPPPNDEENLWVSDGDDFFLTTGSAPSMLSAAEAAYDACSYEESGPVEAIYHETYGSAVVGSFRWRVQLDGTFVCGATTPDSRTVKLIKTKTTTNHNLSFGDTGYQTTVVSEVFANVSWSATDQTLQSVWFTENVPAAELFNIEARVSIVLAPQDVVACLATCVKVS